MALGGDEKLPWTILTQPFLRQLLKNKTVLISISISTSLEYIQSGMHSIYSLAYVQSQICKVFNARIENSPTQSRVQ